MRAIWVKKPVVSRNEKIAIAKLLVRQWVVTLCVTFILYAFWDKSAAISALFGGMLVWVSNILMAIIVFARNTYHDPQKIVKVFYVGELLKIVVMGVLFILVLRFYNIMLAPFLVGLISTYLAYIFV